MSLELSPEVETVVQERAREEGISVSDLLARVFLLSTPSPKNLSSPKARVVALLKQWREEDNTPTVAPVLTQPGETPTQALFRHWREEDAQMTDEERDAEAHLWKDLETALLQKGSTFQIGSLSS